MVSVYPSVAVLPVDPAPGLARLPADVGSAQLLDGIVGQLSCSMGSWVPAWVAHGDRTHRRSSAAIGGAGMAKDHGSGVKNSLCEKMNKSQLVDVLRNH
jgi:hypothetical protein